MSQEDIYRKAGIKCLGNAQNLREAAGLLNESKKTGVAISLLVLAGEELAKAELFRMIAEDIVSIDPRDIGKKYVFDKRVLRDHTLKDFQFSMMSQISPFVKLLNKPEMTLPEIFNFIDPLFKKSDLGEKRVDPVWAFTKKELDKFRTDLEENRELNKILFGNMDELKLKGFYVDIVDGKIITPDDLDNGIFGKLASLIDEYIFGHSDAILHGIPHILKDELLKVTRSLAVDQKVPMFNGMRRTKTVLGTANGYEKITADQAKELSEKCMKNSRSIFEAAKILAKRGRGYQNNGLFGPATSLLTLSHEEYVKAIIFAAVSTGVAVISSQTVKGAFAFHPTQIRCHACKQEMAAWIDIGHFVRAVRGVNEASLEERLKHIQEVLKIPIPEGVDGKYIGMGVPPDMVGRAKMYYELESSLWGLKESCFYVDVTDGVVQSPADLPPQIYWLIESIVGSVVDIKHPFEEPENLRLDLLKDILLPSAGEEFRPQVCPHRGVKRTRGDPCDGGIKKR